MNQPRLNVDGDHNEPHKILEISPDASPEEIRRAYLKKVREFPPEEAPAEFERIRDAYDFLRDPKIRARQILDAGNPFAPLVDLLDGSGREKNHVGPGPWLDVLK